ncbi:YncE family protein [Methylorubrum sp. SB2]|uniref:YncE family protein n=1 Tax=Methylorubrum subtropicum TaxID=3138812 RepID=UPI00313B73E8
MFGKGEVKRVRPRWQAGLLSVALLLAGEARAAEGRAFLIAGLDGKTFFRPEGSVNGPNGRDGLAVIDIADPARPRLAHVVRLDTSVYGPPTNLQITPDGRLGLVTSPVAMRQEGENWWAQGDDRLHVVDLAAEPPALIETIRVGRQPSGLAIAKAGDVALVANREGRSVSVLAIAGRSVRVVAEVDVGAEAAAVALAPDGRRAFVAKNKAGTVGLLTLADGQWRHDPALDMPVGPGTYGLEVTPDGAFALAGNTGPAPSDGHADTVALIRAGTARPVVLDHTGVGDTAETLAISPDGRRAAIAVVKGSAAPQASPAYTPDSAAVLVAIEPEGMLRRLGEAPAGAVVQGIAFDPSGAYVYIGNYTDRSLGVYRIEGETIRETGFRLALPGQPASLRGRP